MSMDDAQPIDGLTIEPEKYECRACHVPKLLTEFSRNVAQGDNGHERHCRACMSRQRKKVPRPDRRALAKARLSDAKDPTPAYDRMFQAQRGVCGSCKEPETALEPSGKVRRMTFYVFVGTTVRALVCSSCMGMIHTSGASVRRCAYLTAFLAAGLPAERGKLDTLNIEGKV